MKVTLGPKELFSQQELARHQHCSDPSAGLSPLPVIITLDHITNTRNSQPPNLCCGHKSTFLFNSEKRIVWSLLLTIGAAQGGCNVLAASPFRHQPLTLVEITLPLQANPVFSEICKYSTWFGVLFISLWFMNLIE